MVINITRKDRDPDAWKAEREPIFTIGDQEYTVPVKVPPAVGLKLTDRVAVMGEAEAMRWIMVEMLGPEGWKALRDCADLEPEDLTAIQEVIRRKVFGDTESEGKG